MISIPEVFSQSAEHWYERWLQAQEELDEWGYQNVCYSVRILRLEAQIHELQVQEGLDKIALEELLAKAHLVVTWTGQDTLKPHAAGYKHLIQARQEYLRARIDIFARVRSLTVRDTDGCTCGGTPSGSDGPDLENCMYHYGASLQPENHRIPWNCPTFYDGCNCKTNDTKTNLALRLRQPEETDHCLL